MPGSASLFQMHALLEHDYAILMYCNVCVKRTRPNAVDRLGCTTYRATLRVELLIHTSSFTFTCGYVGADATSSPSFTLATAHPRLQPAQGSASTTPTSCRARHCNVCVKRTRPNAVDRLGCTTYRATLRVDLLIHMFGFTSTCAYVGADATSSPSLYAGDATPSSPTSARESVHHSNVLACSPL